MRVCRRPRTPRAAPPGMRRGFAARRFRGASVAARPSPRARRRSLSWFRWPTSVGQPATHGGVPMKDQELRFTGSVPASYDRLMVPLLFRPYAEELARRARTFQAASASWKPRPAPARSPRRCITAMPGAEIVATDLNQPMLDIAAGRVDIGQGQLTLPPTRWSCRLPTRSFDLVVCQFGAMFFPDRVRGHSEAWRVLARRRALSARDLGQDRAQPAERCFAANVD